MNASFTTESARLPRRRLVALLALFVVAGGCGKKPPRPKHYPAQVHGTVSLDAETLGFGTVTFLPEVAESAGGRPGIARIESDGSFRVGNANPSKPTGLLPGRYKVTVLAMRPDPAGTGDPIAQLAVPEVYTEPTRTPLIVDVAAGPNRFEFDLRR